MFAIVGTVPDQGFPLLEEQVTSNGREMLIGGKTISVNRGTPALVAAALKTCEVLGTSYPHVFLVGDTGLGHGSRKLYEYLVTHLGKRDLNLIVFHYLQPDVDWHNRVLFAIEEMAPRPALIADAGFMYASKMSGEASQYDLFTPDVGELAFLADEEAPHPFYTRGFILHEENRVPELIARAYRHENAARHLLVKGFEDVVATENGIEATINGYPEEAMEAIGGTGDTLTGLVAGLMSAGMDTIHAAILGAQTNRLAGHYAHPNPATQVMDIIQHIPKALEEILSKWQVGKENRYGR